MEIRKCWLEQGLSTHMPNFKISITISLYQTICLNAVLNQVYDETKNPFLLFLLCQRSLWEDILGEEVTQWEDNFYSLVSFRLLINDIPWTVKTSRQVRIFPFWKIQHRFWKMIWRFFCLFVYFFLLWTISTIVYMKN